MNTYRPSTNYSGIPMAGLVLLYNRTISLADVFKYTLSHVWHSIYTETLYDNNDLTYWI